MTEGKHNWENPHVHAGVLAGTRYHIVIGE